MIKTLTLFFKNIYGENVSISMEGKLVNVSDFKNSSKITYKFYLIAGNLMVKTIFDNDLIESELNNDWLVFSRKQKLEKLK